MAEAALLARGIRRRRISLPLRLLPPNPGPSRLLSLLPEDLLGAVLAFGDLRARYVGVTACAFLRDARARISPAHEHALLTRRFPILKMVFFFWENVPASPVPESEEYFRNRDDTLAS